MSTEKEKQTGSHRDVKDKEKSRREKLAGYLYDLSKLVVGATLLSNLTLFTQGMITWTDVFTITGGVVAAFTCAYMGNKILTY